MKVFTDFIRKIKQTKHFEFIAWTVIFFVLMMILYLYLIHANLSTAPKFVYTQF